MDTADTKEYVTKHIANSEKVVESAIEFNRLACFKGGEAYGLRNFTKTMFPTLLQLLMVLKH